MEEHCHTADGLIRLLRSWTTQSAYQGSLLETLLTVINVPLEYKGDSIKTRVLITIPCVEAR